IVAYTFDGRPVYAKELEAVDAMLIILKDAFKPNLVQTLEGTPAFIHGGPFANVAHGCNSVQATLTALNYADIVVTEAGFGAELGAEKFLDIKCRTSGLVPDAAVIVASLRALKYNGGAFKDELTKENFEALNLGVENLVGHIENLKKFGLPVVVALNRFETDSDEEIFFIENICEAYGAKFAVAEGHARGGEGMTKLAEIVIKLCDKEKELKFAYELGDNIKTKIEKLALNIYGASAVEYSAEAEEKIKLYGSLLDNLPVCMAKTQYSFSDNPELLGRPKDFVFHISDIDLRKGAGFVVAISGSMLQMFGLPKVPNAARMKYENGKIYGLY
ncbi:MAG: formate--tetrahydrofolate ligase, partial [Clostridiales bacterium]|nr:formate--tetrahydrofolate ligase [Clostridiales bacterium]